MPMPLHPGRRANRWIGAAALACSLVTLASSSLAATPGISVELNKVEPLDGTCRVYFVVRNATVGDVNRLALDLVVFDHAGLINEHLLVETPALRAGKTSVQAFDLLDTSCADLARILINDVPECGGEVAADCMDLLQIGYRGKVELFL